MVSRWFREVRVAGHPTRFDLECAEWGDPHDMLTYPRILPGGRGYVTADGFMVKLRLRAAQRARGGG